MLSPLFAVSNPAVDTGPCGCVSHVDWSRVLSLCQQRDCGPALKVSQLVFTVWQAGLCQSYQTLQLEQGHIWGKGKHWVLALTVSVMC